MQLGILKVLLLSHFLNMSGYSLYYIIATGHFFLYLMIHFAILKKLFGSQIILQIPQNWYHLSLLSPNTAIDRVFQLSQSFHVPQDSSHRNAIPEDILKQEQTETGLFVISFHVQL